METANPMSPNEIAVFLGVISVLGLIISFFALIFLYLPAMMLIKYSQKEKK